MASSTIRFTGLASGLDTESMVKSMLTPYKNKVDTKNQDQTMLEWRKDANKEMSAKIYNFYNKFVSNARFEGSFNKKTVTSSNSTAVKIESGATPPEGTHTISSITQLAEAARVNTSAIPAADDATLTKSTKLSELGIGTGSITVSDTLVSGQPKYSDSITITGNMTIGELENKLQMAMPNSNISFDESAEAFFISSRKTGASQQLNINASDADILKNLGWDTDNDGAIEVKGQSAKLTYNGVQVTSESNTVTVNGLKVTVQAPFNNTEPIDSTGKIIITSVPDTEAVVTYVKEFITEYNKLVEDITTKLDADSTRKYKPLTAEQKKEMTEDDIKAWEKKIKDSLFRNDSTLDELTGNMRLIMTKKIEGNAFGVLSSIGITTGVWTEKGKLNIDDTKLREAIAKDSEAVMGLFAGQNGSEGIADKLNTELNSKFKYISGVKSSTSLFNDVLIDQSIKDTKAEAIVLQKKMDEAETRFYTKFTAMEKMMSKLNSQSSWLTQQLGGKS